MPSICMRRKKMIDYRSGHVLAEEVEPTQFARREVCSVNGVNYETSAPWRPKHNKWSAVSDALDIVTGHSGPRSAV